jgi:LysW-gamma-L-lysine carboxypeptidase
VNLQSNPATGTDDEAAVSLLTQMLQVYSPSGKEDGVATFLVDAMTRLGFTAGRDEAGNAVGHKGDGECQIVLLGHMDTVPGEIPVRREEGILFGRGAVDAKGPLAAFVMAAARLGALPGFRVTVIGAVEEETYSSAGAHHIAGVYQPDFAIIGEPSRWDRITLGYKGVLVIHYALRCPMSHTAGQNRGAAEEAVLFWNRMSLWAESYNSGQQGKFQTVDPSLRSISSDNNGLEEWVRMSVGFRLPLALNVEDLLAEIAAGRGQAEVSRLNYERPYQGNKGTDLTSVLLYAIRAEGGTPAFVMKTGTSDMNVVGPVWTCPVVAYGPGDSSLDHTPNENIDVNEYLAAIRVLHRALERLAARAR